MSVAMSAPSCCDTPLVAGSGELGLLFLFVTGLTLSAGHCVGMCGPIVGAVFGARCGGCSAGTSFRAMAAYHAGRILAYGAIGLLLGLLGAAVRAVATPTTFQASLALAAGAVTLVIGLSTLGVLPFSPTAPTHGPGARLFRILHRTARSRTVGRDLGLGIANGFLPCGPVMAVAAAAAATLSPLHAVAAMAAFGLGTVPVLVALPFGLGKLSAGARTHLHRVGGVLVVGIGVQLTLRGLGSLGYLPHLEVGRVVLW
jgi:sulfite exporter TauE/SafE